MRHELMEILVCPVCKSELELVVQKQEGDEIIDGRLTCKECGEQYPIDDGIPNMLPPDLRDE